MSEDPFRIRAHVPAFEAISAEYRTRSDEVRRTVPNRLDVAYGPAPDERLDLFFPANPVSAPVHLFVHGGYWRANVKEDYAFVAAPVVAAGGIAAIVEYTLMPKARMAALVDQVRRAAQWLARNAASFGGDPSRLSASGTSAGGQLAFYLAARRPQEDQLPHASVRSLLLVSGIYDLDPITRSFVQPEIGLTADEVRDWSPVGAQVSRDTRFMLAVGSAETAPFHEQADTLQAVITRQGGAAERLLVRGADHMSIMLEMGTPATVLARALETCVRR